MSNRNSLANKAIRRAEREANALRQERKRAVRKQIQEFTLKTGLRAEVLQDGFDEDGSEESLEGMLWATGPEETVSEEDKPCLPVDCESE